MIKTLCQDDIIMAEISKKTRNELDFQKEKEDDPVDDEIKFQQFVT